LISRKGEALPPHYIIISRLYFVALEFPTSILSTQAKSHAQKCSISVFRHSGKLAFHLSYLKVRILILQYLVQAWNQSSVLAKKHMWAGILFCCPKNASFYSKCL